jgi:membrane fusion protein, heavy metal efflux system
MFQLLNNMNKNLKIFGGIAIAAIIGIILYFLYFKHDPADGHVHGDGTTHGTEKTETAAAHDEHGEGGHADHAHEKMVHLNEAQFKNAGIDTGWFEQKNLSEVINANGYTKLPPQNQAQVSVQLPGTIQRIKVIEGQAVKAGQVLATMQSMAYNNLRLEREKLNQELTATQANLEFLKLEFARQKELSDENVNAKKVFQKVSADLQMEEAKIKTLQSQMAILEQNIEMGGNASSPIINIVAPIAGNITDVNVTIGAAAEVGKPLFSIVDNSQMHVDLLVYEKDLFRVKPGQNVRFMLTNQGNQEIRGKIFSVGKSFENDTKSVAVHADILNEKQILIPGMYVNALIDIGVNRVDALPLEAVVKAEGREFIFLWEKENLTATPEPGHELETSFARIEVKTGSSQLGFVQVTPLVEVHKGDKIVVKGAYYLQSHLQKSEGGGGHSH